MKRLSIALIFIATAALAADTVGKQAVRTVTKSDFQTQLTDQAGTTLANIQSNNSAAGAGGGLQVLSGNVQSSAPSYSAGNFAMPWLDTSGRLQVIATPAAATTQTVNLQQVLGSTISATNPAFVQISNGTTAYTSGQATMANSFPVVIASNQAAIPVTQGVPTGFAYNRGTPTSIAGGGTTVALVCKTGLAISQPTKPYQVVVTGNAAARCTLQFNDNATLTKFADVNISVATPTQTWTPPVGFIGLTTSGTVTTLQYEASCTNIDTTTTDFGCDIVYCQAASGC